VSDSPPLAGVRLRPGAPLVWCRCSAEAEPGQVVVIETPEGARVGRVVVGRGQLLGPTYPEPAATLLRPADEAERAAWEAERFQPRAGRALLEDISRRPDGP
jgi:hypothetical protein